MKTTMLALVLLLVLLGGLWVFLQGPFQDPADAMRDFLDGRGRFEDQLTDPLVLAGPRVRPLVLSAIADREMKRRRYALSYLGCAGHALAREPLLRILSDETERDYFRADALEALWRLDRTEGHALALTYRSHEDLLGQTAERLISTGRPWADCRSWFAAFTRRHE